jgi:hypothetical protein
MDSRQLGTLRFVSLLFLFPGLAGLLVAASFSTYYQQTLPRGPIPSEMRMTPRSINGVVVYQTAEEDRKLSEMEYFSVGVFVAGLGVGVVYLRQWGIRAAISAEEDEYAEDSP